MSRILSDKERAELMAKYKADRLKDAPHNITDKTLIENYGNDAQKALLQKAGVVAAPAKQEPKAKENKTSNTNPASYTENGGTIEGESETEEAENKRAFEVAEYERLHGEKPAENLPADEIRAANLTKEKENTAKTEDATAYLDAFNEYVRLHDGKTPNSELTTEQLKEANSKKVEELKNTPKVQDIPQVPEVASGTPEKKDGTVFFKGQEMIKLRNVKTGETRLYPKQTYLRFMLGRVSENQWVPYEEPDEVKNL